MSGLETKTASKRSRGFRFIALSAVLVGSVGLGWQTKIRHSGELDDYRNLLVKSGGLPRVGTVKVTSLGTTMMLIDDGTDQILIDAFLTPVSLVNSMLNRPVSTDTDVVDAALNKAGADRVRAIFISHSHHDHAFDVAYIAKRTGATVYGSSSSLNIARGGAVPENRLVRLDTRARVQVGGFEIRAIGSKHLANPFGGEAATLDEPLTQPAGIWQFKEGGTYDFLLTTSQTSMLFKGSVNWVAGALDGTHVDALFLGVTGLGNASDTFRENFFAATIDTVKPKLIVPTHWNDFFSPVKEHLPLQRKVVDNIPAAFDAVVAHARKKNIKVELLDAFSSIDLPPR